MASPLHTKWSNAKVNVTEKEIAKKFTLKLGPSLDDFTTNLAKINKELPTANSTSKSVSELMDKITKSKTKIDEALKQYAGFIKGILREAHVAKEISQIGAEVGKQYKALVTEYAKARQKKN